MSQHANTEAARRAAVIRETLGGDDQVVSEDAIQDHPTTAQNARDRIRAAKLGDVVPLDTFPARASSYVTTAVDPQGADAKFPNEIGRPFQLRTFERVRDGWKRVA